MKNFVLHEASTRGHANHGWLKTYHTFSFANYYDPERVRFGTLRVLNDDWVAPGKGFGSHPHDNMEIITIPLEGALRHRDNLGNEEVIRHGDVQVMSAGTGIIHSEFNDSLENPVSLLQIWVFPGKRNVVPRYGQITLDPTNRDNNLQLVVSPTGTANSLWIHQDAWFYLGRFNLGRSIDYKLQKEGNGCYIFVIKGNISVGATLLSERDGMGIWDSQDITITANSEGAEILMADLPMNL